MALFYLAKFIGLNPISTGINLSELIKQYSNCPATNGADNPQVTPIRITFSKSSAAFSYYKNNILSFI